jgi:hypothetical protein
VLFRVGDHDGESRDIVAELDDIRILLINPVAGPRTSQPVKSLGAFSGTAVIEQPPGLSPCDRLENASANLTISSVTGSEWDQSLVFALPRRLVGCEIAKSPKKSKGKK